MGNTTVKSKRTQNVLIVPQVVVKAVLASRDLIQLLITPVVPCTEERFVTRLSTPDLAVLNKVNVEALQSTAAGIWAVSLIARMAGQLRRIDVGPSLVGKSVEMENVVRSMDIADPLPVIAEMDVKAVLVLRTRRTTAAVLHSITSLARTLKIAVPRMAFVGRMLTIAVSDANPGLARRVLDSRPRNALVTNQIRSSPAPANPDRNRHGKRLPMDRAIPLQPRHLPENVTALVPRLKELFKTSMARASHTIARRRTLLQKGEPHPERALPTAERSAVQCPIALL
jgi:hypothetical protein